MKSTLSSSWLRAALVLTGTAYLASCRSPRPPEPPPPQLVKEEWKYPGEWTGGEKPITRIAINVDVQRATLYSGNSIVGWTYVASGIPSFPTPTGSFKIMEKVKDKVSNLYGKGYNAKGDLVNSDFKQGRDVLPSGGKFVAAPMKYFMRLTGDGVGMHIGPIPRPGRRASHGCIRLPSKMAPILFAHTSVGTPVDITGSGPDYQSYLAQSAAKSKANAAKYAAAKKRQDEKAAAAVTTLPADDPNGPAGAAAAATGTPATPTAAPTPAPDAPAPTPAPAPTEEVKPAVPTSPAPAPGGVQ